MVQESQEDERHGVRALKTPRMQMGATKKNDSGDIRSGQRAAVPTAAVRYRSVAFADGGTVRASAA